MSATLIHGGLAVTEDGAAQGDILIDGETIVEIAPRIKNARGATVINAHGLIVLPGAIDVHTHLDLPFATISSCDDFEAGTRAALFGGTTCIVDFATQPRGRSLLQGLALWHDKARGRAVTDYAFHMAVTDYSAVTDEHLAMLVEREGVTSFKAYMAYKDIRLSNPELSELLIRLKRHQGLVMVHAEDGPMMDEIAAQLSAGGHTAARFPAQSHPVAAEARATQQIIAIARAAGAPIYIVHVTAAAALQEIIAAQRAAPGNKTNVIAESCVQHLLLGDDLYAGDDFAVARYVLSPPFRAQHDRDALWQGLATGAISVLATDHCPFTMAQKALGRDDFRRIPNGVAPIEHRLELAYHFGVGQGRIDLVQFMRLCSLNPARLLGLYPRKGVLAPGADADIVLFDPRAPRKIRAATHHTNCDYSLFEGWQVAGSCRSVFVRGSLAIDGGRCLLEPGFGRYQKRGRSSAFDGALS